MTTTEDMIGVASAVYPFFFQTKSFVRTELHMYLSWERIVCQVSVQSIDEPGEELTIADCQI